MLYLKTNCISECDSNYEYTCGSGECIPKYYRCDSEPDCSDESDEKDCSKYLCPLREK